MWPPTITSLGEVDRDLVDVGNRPTDLGRHERAGVADLGAEGDAESPGSESSAGAVRGLPGNPALPSYAKVHELLGGLDAVRDDPEEVRRYYALARS